MDKAKFVKAGKATFTVQNLKTGNRYTYKVTQLVDRETKERKPLWFVKVMNGTNNEYNYQYIGAIRENDQFVHTRGSKVNPDEPSFKAFDWVWKNLNVLPEFVEFKHAGKCGRCGRKLTVPESIDSGFGPECIHLVGA